MFCIKSNFHVLRNRGLYIDGSAEPPMEYYSFEPSAPQCLAVRQRFLPGIPHDRNQAADTCGDRVLYKSQCMHYYCWPI